LHFYKNEQIKENISQLTLASNSSYLFREKEEEE